MARDPEIVKYEFGGYRDGAPLADSFNSDWHTTSAAAREDRIGTTPGSPYLARTRWAGTRNPDGRQRQAPANTCVGCLRRRWTPPAAAARPPRRTWPPSTGSLGRLAVHDSSSAVGKGLAVWPRWSTAGSPTWRRRSPGHSPACWPRAIPPGFKVCATGTLGLGHVRPRARNQPAAGVTARECGTDQRVRRFPGAPAGRPQ